MIPGVQDGSLHTAEIAGFGAGASGSAEAGTANATAAVAKLHRVAIEARTDAILAYDAAANYLLNKDNSTILGVRPCRFTLPEFGCGGHWHVRSSLLYRAPRAVAHDGDSGEFDPGRLV